MIALLVIPACAARFWTEEMSVMTFASAALGALSAFLGAAMSAVLPRLPSGAMIVVVAAMVFTISMFFAPARGLLARAVSRRRLDAKVHRQHLLRAIYESLEVRGMAPQLDRPQKSTSVSISDLVPLRSWSRRHLNSYVRRAAAQGLVGCDANEVWLSALGSREAAKNVHDHRLWELYLMKYADVAPSQVDRGADAIEHVLDAGMVAELESLVRQRTAPQRIPPSPHPVDLGHAPSAST
jgi:manganese/zinc/iron transport system permease protein